MDLLDQLADTFFNWEEMAKVIPALLMVGLPNTLILAVASGIFGSLLGLALAMMGISRNAGARWVARRSRRPTARAVSTRSGSPPSTVPGTGPRRWSPASC